MATTRVPYTDPVNNSKYRPYLEVVFCRGKLEYQTFGLIDSGADVVSIPFSVGRNIGLSVPTTDNEIKPLCGIGGSSTYVERDCHIFLPHHKLGGRWEFIEKVCWLYPCANVLKKLKELEEKYSRFYEISQTAPDPQYQKAIQQIMKDYLHEYRDLSNIYESGVLLGRSFFNNFNFIQFCHRSNKDESKCFFGYSVRNDKKFKKIKS